MEKRNIVEDNMKSYLKCKTPAKAQINFRKHQRTTMNRTERRTAQRYYGYSAE